jgi:hypothetical protein
MKKKQEAAVLPKSTMFKLATKPQIGSKLFPSQ